MLYSSFGTVGLQSQIHRLRQAGIRTHGPLRKDTIPGPAPERIQKHRCQAQTLAEISLGHPAPETQLSALAPDTVTNEWPRPCAELEPIFTGD